MEDAKETEFGTKVAWEMKMMPELLFWQIHAEKAHDITLDDDK